MKIKQTNLNGIYEIENKIFEDHRGLFVKTFHTEEFEAHSLQSDFKESYYSVSNRNVIRGMHFQLPPYDHAKLVYVISGEILDVVVDIRAYSNTFGKYFSTHLSSENAKSLYIAKGFAHGFLTLSTTATVVYLTSSIYNNEADSGLRWDSFGFDWDMDENVPITSLRDENLPSLSMMFQS